MTVCKSCGAENADGLQYCVRCGNALGPAPESWRGSGDAGSSSGSAGGYANPQPAGSSYTPIGGTPSYTPPQTPATYQPAGGPGGSSLTHPAIPALISFFLPGIGLLFMSQPFGSPPNKTNLGLGIFAGFIVGTIVLTILYFGITVITLGFGGILGCCFFLLPLVNIATAIHSYDEAAKLSNGQFSPLIFKK